jgi:hypothetical protein
MNAYNLNLFAEHIATQAQRRNLTTHTQRVSYLMFECGLSENEAERALESYNTDTDNNYSHFNDDMLVDYDLQSMVVEL